MAHLAGLDPDIVDRVLDNVERRAFLVEPAGEGLAPDRLGFARDDLHERAGPFFRFPRVGFLAGAQAHDEITNAHRLTRLHHEITRQAVALVENAQRRHALGHRRGFAIAGDGRGGTRLGLGGFSRSCLAGISRRFG